MHGTIAAVILAGGGGRRLGGVDKALLPLAGQPLLTHVLERLRPQTDRILLSANGDPGRFTPFALPVIADAVPGQGPLGGIAAAAAECRRRWPDVQWLLTVPVDTPLLPANLVECFAAARENAPRKAIVAEAGGRQHWTVALWPIGAAAALADLIKRQGLRRLEDGLGTVGWQSVAFPAPEAFANVNNEQDLEYASRLLRDL